VHIQKCHLKRGTCLSRIVTDDGGFTAVYGEGGGCVLDVTGNAAGIWIPLHGGLRIQSAGLTRELRVGDGLVTEHEPRTKAIGHANARWVALLGGRRAWTRLLHESAAGESQLFPELHGADRDLRRIAVQLVRASAGLEMEAAVRALTDRLISLQSPLHAVIARCPGRTSTKRRQAFLRLHRVRNFISASCDREIDNGSLARMANYSACHFLRTFNLVYDETPHAYLVNQRLQRARRLLRFSDLAIAEVALASGFENRSAFSRLYRQRFGMTAVATKRSIASPFDRSSCSN
jgi:AraC family transcriptional regulator